MKFLSSYFVPFHGYVMSSMYAWSLWWSLEQNMGQKAENHGNDNFYLLQKRMITFTWRKTLAKLLSLALEEVENLSMQSTIASEVISERKKVMVIKRFSISLLVTWILKGKIAVSLQTTKRKFSTIFTWLNTVVFISVLA